MPGVFHDARIYAEPWGFDLAEIRVPVRLWVENLMTRERSPYDTHFQGPEK